MVHYLTIYRILQDVKILGYYKKRDVMLLRCYENYNSHLESVRINWNHK